MNNINKAIIFLNLKLTEDSLSDTEAPAIGKTVKQKIIKLIHNRCITYLLNLTCASTQSPLSPPTCTPESDFDKLSCPVSPMVDSSSPLETLSSFPSTSAADAIILCDQRPENKKESETVEHFHQQGCGCSEKCSSRYPLTHYTTLRSQCAELDHNALDMVIMGQLMALTKTNLEKHQTIYMHLGEKVYNLHEINLLGKHSLLFH